MVTESAVDLATPPKLPLAAEGRTYASSLQLRRGIRVCGAKQGTGATEIGLKASFQQLLALWRVLLHQP
jgi:hypothetical protein